MELAGGEGARLLPSREARDVVERPLPVHADVLTEIRRVAARFRASPAAVVGLAWLVFKRTTGRKR